MAGPRGGRDHRATAAPVLLRRDHRRPDLRTAGGEGHSESFLQSRATEDLNDRSQVRVEHFRCFGLSPISFVATSRSRLKAILASKNRCAVLLRRSSRLFWIVGPLFRGRPVSWLEKLRKSAFHFGAKQRSCTICADRCSSAVFRPSIGALSSLERWWQCMAWITCL